MDNDSKNSANSDEEDHSNSSGSKNSTDGSSSRSTDRSALEVLQPRLAAQESKAIVMGKMLMYFLLLAIASGSAVAVYKYTRKEQVKDLDNRFTDIAMQILSVYRLNAVKIVEVFEKFSYAIAAQAVAANATWPFVTVQGFEALASRAMETAGASSLAVTHIIQKDQREAWEQYTSQHWENWIQQGFTYWGVEGEVPTYHPSIFVNTQTFEPLNDTLSEWDFYSPIWQFSPISGGTEKINYEHLGNENWEHAFRLMMEVDTTVLSEVENLNEVSDDSSTWPSSFIVVPIHSEILLETSISDLVATLSVTLPWHSYFVDLLPESINPINLVISNTCNQTFTYEIDGPHVTYKGLGDLHNQEYSDLGVTTDFNPFDLWNECEYALSVYPTGTFASTYETNEPLVYTIVVVCIFIFTISVFFIYDMFVERRQTKVMSTAERSNAIVSSLFPQAVALRLMEDAAGGQASDEAEKHRHKMLEDEKWRRGLNREDLNGNSKPIAELFPSASVMFADIVGFTAWSSEREPSQVFELLEKIYSSFDHIAKRKKIFKVETIGDCYMAAAGLPERRDDHAIAMACFARDCLRKMLHVVRKLESSLGPSTGELGMRVGIHSGPVTAGVLRGEKARFQLFGDTVNTAARMESTGAPNKIQVSAETAALIEESGNDQIWVVAREQQVDAKGKGKMKTFWLAYANMGGAQSRLSESMESSHRVDTTSSSEMSVDEDVETMVLLEDSEQKKQERSIDWTTDVLLSLLRRVVAMRGGVGKKLLVDYIRRPTATRPLDEVADIINLHSQQRSYAMDPAAVEFSPEVVFQLRAYVREICGTYHQNFFHNFEHATHVTMSVTKLLSRVVAPNEESYGNDQVLHEYTFGITSDPLAQFAVAFAALIHDVDHQGVPNSTLVREKTTNAIRYRNQSVAEQNSVDMAWKILSVGAYSDLRACIYSDEEEFQRFRQLVVNAVMATDIVDKELGAARKARWMKAFATDENGSCSEEDPSTDANRKATIVIEHLIQASDVAHTMQHWHVYIRWNERYFRECYSAYLAGRLDKDPSLDWYKSEIGFFDFYIIPLAKKLKDCQVFGVASDEYLTYAEANRNEWEAKGEELVKNYLESFRMSELRQ